MAKTHEIRVKFSPEDYERVREKAKQSGHNLASFLRFLALKTEVIVKIKE